LKAKEPKILSQNEALEKLKYFCAYQERSKKQVLTKMNSLACPEEWRESFIMELINGQYLNEDRYKNSYAKGKSTLKGWGPNKIEQHLQFETGENVDISSILKPEDFEKSRNKLKKDLEKKLAHLNPKADSDTMGKLIRFCLSRGFSFEDAKGICYSVVNQKDS